MWRAACLFVLSVAACSLPATASDEASAKPTAERPRIGLVLSGGGARGAAHIGVLKRLHEMQVPVDFVVGTSMGALVGGLYASGMTPEEIEVMARGLDFNDMFRDGPAPAELPIRRKLQEYNYLLDVEVGIHDGQLFFPTGVLRGQKMALLLRRLTLPVRNTHDFDALPTPFRAIATDLATAEAVIFNSGDLVTAMRASMAVPGVFFPVNYRGRKLVDGGIVQNLPVPVAQQYGADILIVVDVGMTLDPVDTLGSPFAVSSQVIDGMMLSQSRRHLERLDEQDVVIRPELGDYDSTDFDAIPSIIDKGAVAAESQSKALLQLSLDDAAWQTYLASRRRPQDEVPRIAEVVVADSARRFERQLKAHTQVEKGMQLDTLELEESLIELHGLRRYGMLDYRVEPIGQDAAGERLVLDAEPREIGRQVAEFGFQLSDDFKGDTRFVLSAGLTFLDLNALGGEWRNDLHLGEITGLESELYQPVTYDGSFFVSARGRLFSQIFRVENDAGLAANYRINQEIAGADAGLAFGNTAEWRLGFRVGNEDINDVRGDPFIVSGTQARIGDVVSRFRFDNMDSFAFPSSGVRFGLTWVKSREWLGSEQAFEYAGVEWLSAYPFIGERNRILFGLELQTVIEGERNLSERMTLGGLTRLSGIPTDSLVGRHSALARLVYSRYLGQDPDRLFDLPLYAGMTLEAGNVWQTRDAISRDDLIRAGSLFLALDTGLGPIGIAYGQTSDGDSSFYLTIGSVTGPRLQPLLR